MQEMHMRQKVNFICKKHGEQHARATILMMHQQNEIGDYTYLIMNDMVSDYFSSIASPTN